MKILKQAGESHPVHVKKSKFIASASPALSEKEAREFIQKIKQHHKKATHHASAYRIMTSHGPVTRADDDGEPRGTAGGSILFVLEKMGIINAVVVVSRYYGGVKLGKGGLVKSYSNAAVTIIKAIGTVDNQSENQ